MVSVTALVYERPGSKPRPAQDPADPRVQCNVRLPESMVAQVDSLKGRMSRDAWIEHAVALALDSPTVTRTWRAP